jgi:uncharacterized membrane protein YdjX (TVP38/TMEM64 family)
MHSINAQKMHAFFDLTTRPAAKPLAVEGVSKQIKSVPKQNRAPWSKLLVLMILVGGALVASRYITREQLLALIERARSVGWPGYVAFIFGYAIWCSLGLPGSLLSMGAAAAFGFWRGLGLVYLGANLAAVCGFLLSRYFARDWFTQVVGRHMALAQINRAVAESGWRIVMLTRLPPISPFGIVNYAYGLTPVSLRDYMIGTSIGMIPGTAAYIYLGTILTDLATRTHRTRTPFEWGLYICGFIITVVVCVYIVRMARAALARHAIAEKP